MLEKLTTVPLVIAAHGTRDPEGVTACRALAERVRTKLPGTKVTIGFIELAEPRIPEAVADALKDSAPRGGAEAVVVPLMLASGGHVRIDIPEAIDKGRGNSEVAYSAALLGSPLLDSAVRRRVVEALGEWRPQDTACILVGRGSSVVESNAERYRMARVLMEEAGLRSIHPAFIQVSRPSVPEALNHAKATGVKQIVVAPHFLFPDNTSPARGGPGPRATAVSPAGPAAVRRGSAPSAAGCGRRSPPPSGRRRRRSPGSSRCLPGRHRPGSRRCGGVPPRPRSSR